MARLFDDAAAEYANHAGAVLTGAPMTVACWFLSDNNVADQALLNIHDTVANNYFYLWLRGSRVGDEIGWVSRLGGAQGIANSTAGYTINVWQHACGVEYATNSRASFLNGTNKGVNAGDITPAGLDTTRIARAPRAGATYMSGRIAEVGIWNVALADAEVAALAGGVPPTRIRPQNLVAYWPLYGVGSPEPDYRGTYDMTLVNAPVHASHAPTQMPFGFDLGAAGLYTVTPVVTRIPRPPAAYNTLAVY